ncbi:MAG: sulfite exporter TauE/SafE family protein [Leptospirillia bacterium]
MYSAGLESIYLLLGGMSGFLSGLLGIGGGVVLLPALLFLLPLVSHARIAPFMATEISMIQVAFASLTGILAHRPSAHVPLGRLLFWAGSALAGGAMGAVVSWRLPGEILLWIFLAETLLALTLLLFRSSERHSGEPHPPTRLPAEFLAIFSIGLSSGILGVGGGFLLYPVLTLLFGYPSFVAVGSSLAVMFPMAATAALTKALVSGGVPHHTMTIVVGALIGSFLGARFTRRLGGRRIRIFQGFLLLLTAIRLVYALITRGGY